MDEIKDVTNDFDFIEALAPWLIRHYTDSQELQEVIYNGITVRAGEGDTEESICGGYNFQLKLKEKESKSVVTTADLDNDPGTWG